MLVSVHTSSSTDHAPPLRVGLLWHSASSPNLGVGALTVAQIAVLDEIGRDLGRPIEIEIIGWVDDRHAYVERDDVTIHGIRLKNFLPWGDSLLRIFRRLDVVVDIGAGDSFADIYGRQRFATQAASKALVLAARRPLVLAPQTLGPFDGRISRFVAARLVERAALAFSRDEQTTSFVREFCPDADICEATDLAMALPYVPATDRALGPSIKVGMNVSSLLMEPGASKQFGLAFSYPDYVRSAIRQILARPDTELHLVPHVIPTDNPAEDDYAASERLRAEFPAVKIAPAFHGPSEAKSYIAGLDAFTGARMHSCIAAFSSSVPVLPVAYSRKFEGLFSTLGYERLVDLKNHDMDEALERQARFLDDLPSVRTEIVTSFAQVENRLRTYREALAELIAEVVAS